MKHVLLIYYHTPQRDSLKSNLTDELKTSLPLTEEKLALEILAICPIVVGGNKDGGVFTNRKQPSRWK